MKQGSLSYFTSLQKIMLLLGLMVGMYMIAVAFLYIIGFACFRIETFDLQGIKNNLPFLKALQITQSISLFILPAYGVSYLCYNNPTAILSGPKKLKLSWLSLTLVIVIISQGLITWSGWLNHQIHWPEVWFESTGWITKKEAEATEMTRLLLTSNSVWDYPINLVMMAAIPALGEEWLFRGLLQRELTKLTGSSHSAIIFTAILFSAFHIQFLSFLPRFILGLLFGYMLYFTNNLWIPILAHFVNNALAITVFYLYYQHLPTGIESNDNPSILLVLLSSIGTSVLMFMLYKRTTPCADLQHGE